MDTSMINKIQKAKEYAEQPERVTFHTLALEFHGDNSTYNLALGPDGWSCSCHGFQKYSICPHVMAIEIIFKPMLKREPVPYANGQNIVSDVRKAKTYSQELHRIKIQSFQVSFQGDNKDHTVSYNDGIWDSTSSFFKSHGLCPYTMAMERILGDMVKPITILREQAE
jgi:hypothetical protein